MKYAAVVLAILFSAGPCTARTVYVDVDATASHIVAGIVPNGSVSPADSAQFVEKRRNSP